MTQEKWFFNMKTKVIQHKIDKWGILSTLLYELVVRIKPYNNRPWNFISILFSVQGGYQILDGGHDITSQNKCWPKPQKDKYLKKKLVSSKINWFLLHILPKAFFYFGRGIVRNLRLWVQSYSYLLILFLDPWVLVLYSNKVFLKKMRVQIQSS